MSERRSYYKVFFAMFGFGPYECYFCHEPVSFDEVAIHHHNGDRDCNHPYNLLPSHPACHHSWHGMTRGPETKAKLRASRLGKKASLEARAKMSTAARKRKPHKHTPATRAKLSEIKRQYWKDRRASV